MYLKRQYDKDLKVKSVVKVLRAGKRQNFSENFLQNPFVTKSADKITLHGVDGDVVYKIKRVPGHYCSHCGVAIPDAGQVLDATTTVGQKHVREKHVGAKSPDPQNPAGYERINHYECVKE